jgi:hypothetical protein
MSQAETEKLTQIL